MTSTNWLRIQRIQLPFPDHVETLKPEIEILSSELCEHIQVRLVPQMQKDKNKNTISVIHPIYFADNTSWLPNDYLISCGGDFLFPFSFVFRIDVICFELLFLLLY